MLCHYRIPLVTLSLTATALVAAATPGLNGMLQLDWSEVASGQLWRLWSGHLVHWTVDHLFWDVAVFLVLGAALERTNRAKFVAVLGLGLPVISAGLALLCAEISVYRGLSGIDTGLFVWLLLSWLRRELDARQWGLVLLWTLLLGGLAGKLIYEAVTGQCLFVSTSPSSFRPLVESHLLGAAVGCAAWGLRDKRDGIAGPSAAAARGQENEEESPVDGDRRPSNTGRRTCAF